LTLLIKLANGGGGAAVGSAARCVGGVIYQDESAIVWYTATSSAIGMSLQGVENKGFLAFHNQVALKGIEAEIKVSGI
jgi:hypothetical protein